jgi:dTDP-4-dehydrorhamnose reductase
VGGDPPILIAGGTGALGSALAHACETRGLDAVALGRPQLDITSSPAILAALRHWQPWAVVNAAGFARVDDAETHAEACWRLNTVAAQRLAAGAAEVQAHYVAISSDLVFDGLETRPYVESDGANPRNTYGASKRAAEERILGLFPEALIVRTAAFFGSAHRSDFLTRVLREIVAGREVIAADDIVVSPTYVPHLAAALLDLLIDREVGIRHLANRGQVSWADFAALGARLAGLDESLVRRVSKETLGFIAERPAFSALGSERGSIMPTLDAGIREYLASPVRSWRTPPCGTGPVEQDLIGAGR